MCSNSSGGHFIFNNTIRNTTGGNCIHLEGTDNNTIINNTCDNITGSTRFGIRFMTTAENPHASNNVFYRNNLSRVQGKAVSQYTIAGAVNNTFLLNQFIGNGFDINMVDANNSYNSTFGNFYSQLNASNFTDSDGDGFYDSGPGWPFNASTGANFSSNVQDYRPCVYRNCLGLASQSPARNASVSSQSVSFTVRSRVPPVLSSLGVFVNGTLSSAFSGSSNCVLALNDSLGWMATCAYTETGVPVGSVALLVNATDQDGITGNFSWNFTYSAPSPTPTPTPGGGCTVCGQSPASSPAPSPSPTPPPATATLLFLEPGVPVAVAIPGSEVREVVLVAEQPVVNVQVSVQRLAARPPDAPAPPGGAVLSYLRIEAVGRESPRLREARIRFEVARGWLENGGLDPDGVRLERYEDNRRDWSPLDTVRVGGNETHLRYEAVSPGLSIFAVTARLQTEQPTAPTPMATARVVPTPSPVAVPSSSPVGAVSPSPMPSAPAGSPGSTPSPRSPGLEVASTVGALAVACFVARKYQIGRRNR